MLAAFLLLLRSLALICGGHRAVALENVALRQQLAVFKRTNPRPLIQRRVGQTLASCNVSKTGHQRENWQFETHRSTRCRSDDS